MVNDDIVVQDQKRKFLRASFETFGSSDNYIAYPSELQELSLKEGILSYDRK